MVFSFEVALILPKMAESVEAAPDWTSFIRLPDSTLRINAFTLLEVESYNAEVNAPDARCSSVGSPFTTPESQGFSPSINTPRL